MLTAAFQRGSLERRRRAGWLERRRRREAQIYETSAREAQLLTAAFGFCTLAREGFGGGLGFGGGFGADLLVCFELLGFGGGLGFGLSVLGFGGGLRVWFCTSGFGSALLRLLPIYKKKMNVLLHRIFCSFC